MAARKWGTGSVEEYAPGKHRVRSRVNGKMATLATSLPKAAATRYADALTEVRHERAELKFRALVELARAERQRRTDLKTSTIRQEQSALTLIANGLGHIPVRELQARDIRDWLKEKARTESTQKNRLNLIRYVLQLAVDDDIVPVNVALSVKLKTKSGRLKKSDLLSHLLWPYQQQALIDKLIEPGRFRLSESEEQDQIRRLLLLASYLFALGTGCRLSEQWGVKREDVSEGAILISRSVANEAPKSGDWREVPILPPTAAALRVLERVRGLSKRIAQSEWLFPGELGEQRKWSRPPRGWRDLQKAARVPYKNWHWLRHTCATSLLSGWWGEAWDPRDIQAQLGHASVTTTEIYAQLLDDAAFKAAEKSFQTRSRKREVGNVSFSAV